MKPLFSRSLGYGLIALGLLAGTVAPTVAAPLPQPAPATPALVDAATPVRDSWAGSGPARGNYEWRRRGGHRERGDWRNNRQWRGDRHWQRDDWRGRRHYRGSYLGLGGFGLGLGLGLAAPRYYDDYYYDQPRRVYRGLSPAHVRWCSARYRTYRAWDNTYVPRRGVRAICRSPFG